MILVWHWWQKQGWHCRWWPDITDAGLVPPGASRDQRPITAMKNCSSNTLCSSATLCPTLLARNGADVVYHPPHCDHNSAAAEEGKTCKLSHRGSLCGGGALVERWRNQIRELTRIHRALSYNSGRHHVICLWPPHLNDITHNPSGKRVQKHKRTKQK